VKSFDDFSFKSRFPSAACRIHFVWIDLTRPFPHLNRNFDAALRDGREILKADKNDHLQESISTLHLHNFQEIHFRKNFIVSTESLNLPDQINV